MAWVRGRRSPVRNNNQRSRDRADRRAGYITARQQKKRRKAARREAKRAESNR